MISTKTIYIILFFSILFFGCKKDAIKVNQDFEGHWSTNPAGPSSDDIIINISKGKSYVKYTYPGNKILDTDGKAKIQDDILYIGKFNRHITSYPGYDSLGNKIFKLYHTTYYQY